jgi:hypothetical protein
MIDKNSIGGKELTGHLVENVSGKSVGNCSSASSSTGSVSKNSPNSKGGK